MDFNYSDLGLKTNSESITFKFNDKEIEIFRYLPLEYKYDAVMSAIHDSDEQGVCNYLKLDAYFNLNMFLSYVKNVNFTQTEINDKLKLYNEIYSSGLLDAFLIAVDEKEYNDCYEALEKIIEMKIKYNNSFSAILKKVADELPKRTEDMANLIQNLDEDKMNKIREVAALMTNEDKKSLN